MPFEHITNLAFSLRTLLLSNCALFWFSLTPSWKFDRSLPNKHRSSESEPSSALKTDSPIEPSSKWFANFQKQIKREELAQDYDVCHQSGRRRVKISPKLTYSLAPSRPIGLILSARILERPFSSSPIAPSSTKTPLTSPKIKDCKESPRV